MFPWHRPLYTASTDSYFLWLKNRNISFLCHPRAPCHFSLASKLMQDESKNECICFIVLLFAACGKVTYSFVLTSLFFIMDFLLIFHLCFALVVTFLFDGLARYATTHIHFLAQICRHNSTVVHGVNRYIHNTFAVTFIRDIPFHLHIKLLPCIYYVSIVYFDSWNER